MAIAILRLAPASYTTSVRRSARAPIEGEGDDDGRGHLAADLHAQPLSRRRQVDRHVRHPQGLLEGGAPGAAGHRPHRVPAAFAGMDRMPLAGDAAPLDLEPHQLAANSRLALRRERFPAEEVGLLAELD